MGLCITIPVVDISIMLFSIVFVNKTEAKNIWIYGKACVIIKS